MSASTEKKLRRAAREAGNDKKAIAAAEEAAKKARSKRRWTLGSIGVVLLIAFILFLNSGFIHTGTTAVKIGDESYSPAELNYYYANQYHGFANQYGQYASIFGLDTSTGIAGLDEQNCTMMEDGTWRDYFMEAALNQMAQNEVLLDYAQAQGLSLTEDEIAAVDAGFEGIEQIAQAYGYASADNYIAANYGNGVDMELVRQAELDIALASKAATAYYEALEYDSAALAEHYKSFEGSKDYFDYVYYYVAGETTEVAAEDGSTTQEVSAEALAEAKATAEAIVAEYKSAEPSQDIAAALDAAIATQVADASCTQRTHAAGSGISADYSEWMLLASRKQGDITLVEDGSAKGYYVVVFGSRDNNDYASVAVRHILIKAVAEADGTYTDEAKAEAKSRAEEILKEWEAGDKTEESFAALAEQYSEDTGSNTNGGLYEEIGKGQMVEEFDAFCFGGHKSGDTDIVYGDNGSYAGYHVIYFVGEGELYSNCLAKADLADTDYSQWLNTQLENYKPVESFAIRFVG